MILPHRTHVKIWTQCNKDEKSLWSKLSANFGTWMGQTSGKRIQANYFLLGGFILQTLLAVTWNFLTNHWSINDIVKRSPVILISLRLFTSAVFPFKNKQDMFVEMFEWLEKYKIMSPYTILKLIHYSNSFSKAYGRWECINATCGLADFFKRKLVAGQSVIEPTQTQPIEPNGIMKRKYLGVHLKVQPIL